MRPRTIASAPDEGGYLASVSDLMSGLIFIFIIALVTFALGLREQEEKQRIEVERLQGTKKERDLLLQAVKADLAKQKITVTIDTDQGVLRLGEGILFPLGKADLEERGRDTVARLADVLSNVLPCYTRRVDRPRPGHCADLGRAGQLDAVFIEGHTDNVALAGYGQFRDNWDLSTARAKAIFTGLTTRQPVLDLLLNQHQQPVLGVSGYADRRRVVENDSDENRRRNRRIDLRFVMVPPPDAVNLPAEQTRQRMS